MTDSGRNSTERFTGLANLYARCRPSYPLAAVDHIVQRCGLQPGMVLVDVGCGTGISSRLMGERGLRVIGVEPNSDMRRQAEADSFGAGGPVYREGKAEQTGLPDASADAVLAAQAFHWFEHDAALAEFHRILRPGGWLVLMWNQRDEADDFTAAYGKVIRSVPDAVAVEGPWRRMGKGAIASPLFEAPERGEFSNSQELDEEAMLGRAFSASYAPHSGGEAERFANDLRSVFRQFRHNGRVVLRYRTSVFTARRR